MYSLLRHAQTGSILVLTVLLGFQSAGWLLAWRMAQSNIREQAAKALTNTGTPVEALTLHALDLAKCRMGRKEIWHGSHLYDIRTETPCGDSVQLTLYHDKREEALFKILGLRLAAAAPGEDCSTPGMYWIAQWLGLMYLTPHTPALPKVEEEGAQTHAFEYLLPLRQAFPALYGLPPETHAIIS